jgi:hypothetical protein
VEDDKEEYQLDSGSTIDTISITSCGGGYDTIDIGNINIPDYTYVDNSISTVTISGAGSSGAIGGAGSSGVWLGTGIGGGTGSSYISPNSWSNGNVTYNTSPTMDSSIQLGEDFVIKAPKGKSPVFSFKGQELSVENMFSMFGAFKTMLAAVAKDEEFCKKHPEIRDLAYGYMLEELKK